MHVLITSPQGHSQEYDVNAVAGMNAQGPFSILPNHTHFLTIISGDVLLYPETVFGEKSEPIKVEVGTGVLRCVDGNVEIYRQLVTVDGLTDLDTPPNSSTRRPPDSQSSPARK